MVTSSTFKTTKSEEIFAAAQLMIAAQSRNGSSQSLPISVSPMCIMTCCAQMLRMSTVPIVTAADTSSPWRSSENTSANGTARVIMLAANPQKFAARVFMSQ